MRTSGQVALLIVTMDERAPSSQVSVGSIVPWEMIGGFQKSTPD